MYSTLPLVRSPDGSADPSGISRQADENADPSHFKKFEENLFLQYLLQKYVCSNCITAQRKKF